MNVFFAFGAGLLSFVSPCVLPLVPAYLVDLTGTAAIASHARGRAFAHALAFVLGFSLVFTALWAAIAAFGVIAGELVFWAQRVAGLVLIVLGLHMLGLITVPFLAMTRMADVGAGSASLRRSFAIGVSFGAGWTPCIGPYLAAILAILLTTSDLLSGSVLLFAYALGLGVPFLLAALAIDRLRGVLRALQRRARVIEVAGGTLVIAMGVLLVSGRFTQLAQMLNFFNFTFGPAT